MRIADTPLIGTITVTDLDGVKVTRADMIAHRNLQVSTRKWVMARLNARRYGDRTIIAGDEDSPLKVQHEQLVANAEELRKKIRTNK